jgi:hypothetical protein
VHAIPTLQRSECLRRACIEYIPDPALFSNDPFLQGIAQSIVTILNSAQLLLSSNDEFICPNEAMILPSEFIIDGEPLFLETEMNKFLAFGKNRKFLSFHRYYRKSPKARRALQILSIPIFDVHSVRQIVRHPEFAFPRRSLGWLRRFVKYLSGLRSNDCSDFLNLRFLKIQNNLWMSLSPSIYLPPYSSVRLPPQINLKTLADDFYNEMWADAVSRDFFSSRLTRLTELKVIEAITTYHRQLHTRQTQPSQNVLTVIVEHATFLTERLQTWQNLPEHVSNLKSCFQLAVTANRYGAACEIVNDHTYDSEEGKWHLSSIDSENVIMLDRSKYVHMKELIDVLCLRKFPPLLIPGPFHTWQLSRFYEKDLAPKKLRNNKLLYLLAAIWGMIPESEKPTLRTLLPHMEAVCLNSASIFHSLRDCYLSTRELKRLLSPEMNILHISDPDSPRWAFLDTLGVTVRPNHKLYVERLRKLKLRDSPLDSTWKAEIESIYESLAELCGPNEGEELR